VIESRRHHANHRVLRVTQLDHSANDLRVLPEVGRPHAVAEHDDQRHAEPIVFGCDRATAIGVNAEKIEEIVGDDTTGDEHRLGPGVERFSTRCVRCHRIERVERIRAQHLVERLVGHVAGRATLRGIRLRWLLSLDRDFAQKNEAIAVLEGQRTEPNGVDDAERGSGGAEREREREDDRGGVAGASHQRANRGAKVEAECIRDSTGK
jgi:hypothetical protein